MGSDIAWLKPEWLCDLSLSEGVVAHGKNLDISQQRSLYLKVNKAVEVVLFVLCGQCLPIDPLNSDRMFFNRWNEDH